MCFSFAGPPSDTNFPNARDTSLVSSDGLPETEHWRAIMFRSGFWCFTETTVYSSNLKALFWESWRGLLSVYIQAPLDFIFCNPQIAKAANYRVDIPRGLQRFSINIKPSDPGFVFYFTVRMQLCIHALCHTHIRVKLSRSAGVFIVTVSVLFLHLCVSGVLMWANSKWCSVN